MGSYSKVVLTGLISVFLVFGCASHEISKLNSDKIKNNYRVASLSY